MSKPLVTCPDCGKLVPQTRTGKVWGHSPSVRFPDAVTADGRCSGSGKTPEVAR